MIALATSRRSAASIRFSDGGGTPCALDQNPYVGGIVVRTSRVEPAIVDLIHGADAGNVAAAQQLFAALYNELHRVAERQLRRTGADLSLGTTTLLHEAYLDIASREGVAFPDRARFMGYASRAMRTLVIDYARRSRAKKRGGGSFEITLTASDAIGTSPALFLGEERVELDELSDALDELAAVEPPLAQLVDLHFFGGLSLIEIASLRGVSERTVQRDWRKARLFLSRVLREV
jgi:RNA polymerase sigma factor (TIGR02999 family)